VIKSLSTVVDSPDKAQGFVRDLAASAREMQADLLVTMLTAAPMISPVIAPLGGLYLPEAELRADAREDMLLLRAGLKDDEHVTIGGYYGDIGWLAHELRNSEAVVDLTVIGPAITWEVAWLRRHVIETLLLASGTPLLLLPESSWLRKISRATLAWKPSGEAVRAARDLMALAEPGAHIDIVTVSHEDVAESDRGGGRCAIADYLTDHGFDAECHFINDGGTTAEQLQRFALTHKSDVLAIGAYAHSRIREILLGGVTRFLTDDARVPLLMSR
jgi:nucleotide-binding universal stress UspA family protein